MWQELVNSDKQLAQNRESITKKNRRNNNHSTLVEDVDLPLISSNINPKPIPTFVLNNGEIDDLKEEK